ncbi:hypothetical protein ACFLRF_00355 [Candidatus Altiarchaeota archaeon]
MPKKGKGKSLGGLGDIPFGGVFKILESVGELSQSYIKQKYRVEEKIEEFREDTEKKIEEVRKEAVKTAYEAKKALLRTIVEAILVSTGLVSLVVGAILWVKVYVPLHVVLMGYGLVVTIVVLLQMKTAPQN